MARGHRKRRHHSGDSFTRSGKGRFVGEPSATLGAPCCLNPSGSIRQSALRESRAKNSYPPWCVLREVHRAVPGHLAGFLDGIFEPSGIDRPWLAQTRPTSSSQGGCDSHHRECGRFGDHIHSAIATMMLILTFCMHYTP